MKYKILFLLVSSAVLVSCDNTPISTINWQIEYAPANEQEAKAVAEMTQKLYIEAEKNNGKWSGQSSTYLMEISNQIALKTCCKGILWEYNGAKRTGNFKKLN